MFAYRMTIGKKNIYVFNEYVKNQIGNDIIELPFTISRKMADGDPSRGSGFADVDCEWRNKYEPINE